MRGFSLLLWGYSISFVTSKSVRKMDQIVKKFNYYSKRRSIKYGVPFLLLILGGSFGLKEFTQLRYTFSKKLTLKPDEVEKAGVKMKQTGEVTLETEYEKIKEIDIEHWENVRGPRPWEEVGTKQ